MKLLPADWRIRVTSAVAVAVCVAAAMIFGPLVGIDGFLPGGVAIVVAIIVGIVLGGLVGRLLFRPSSDGPPDPPPDPARQPPGCRSNRPRDASRQQLNDTTENNMRSAVLTTVFVVVGGCSS